jgi:3-hydroxyisobutyrate dehydrogenase-like beta-hydroxyacid dehydrogenase
VIVNHPWIIVARGGAAVKVGILHPGDMGVTVGICLQRCGHEVAWLQKDRSEDTRLRAEPFTGFDSLTTLCKQADVIISVCPPDAACTVAEQVRQADFAGTFVDANAVAPSTAETIADLFGDRYVDGGIIGPPALQPGTTRLYLCGERASSVAAMFDGANLQAIVMQGNTSAASALKMAYAAYTKGSSALLLAVNGLAEAAGVTETLQQEWQLSQPGLIQRSEKTALATSRKAWRFAGEMREIAKTFEAHGLPGQFHSGAAQLYELMAQLKTLPPASLSEVVQVLLQASAEPTPDVVSDASRD